MYRIENNISSKSLFIIDSVIRKKFNYCVISVAVVVAAAAVAAVSRITNNKSLV